MKLYTGKEIEELTEVDRYKLSQWINKGIIEPAVDNSNCGGICMFDLGNLIDINLCRKLDEIHLPPHALASALKQLHRFGLSKYRFFPAKNRERKKSFWDYYLATHETIRWFLVVMQAHPSDDGGKVDGVFLKAYRDCGLDPPEDIGEFFLVFPVPRERLQSALELARLAIVLKLDQIVDKVLEGFLSEEQLLSQMA